ncbi:hypothetical protein NEMBOFW57_003774 [Staphylotrichum longicolle]|uniref:Uncharacterized protein n=1 Tax=Staphylotrichum longicolle TaxID=669026 RepID=A0AAD4I311_9PEZI|nr:hypothetical protein NEMBOFW57_003774 [Staphylotrichum longicolle]
MMETGVRQLPAEQQREIAALARNTGGERILDALRTNGFGIDIEGVQHLALFIDGSHSGTFELAKKSRIVTLGQASELTKQRVDELVREALAIIEEEDLQPQLVEYYQQFAKAYLMAKNLEKAREFVAKADKMWRFYGGEEHENLDGMRALWQALEEAETETGEE